MSEPLLEIRDLASGYSGVTVLRGLNLSVDEGEVVALLGANGAGKTTTLRTISRLIRPSAGKIRLGGENTDRWSPQSVARWGVAHVPEGRGIFFGLTVAEHFRLGYRRERLKLENAAEYFPALEELGSRRAGLLSGGEQQMLAVGRALARRPRLLLLDELSLGLAPKIVEVLLPVIRAFADDTGCAVLLVEQHVPLALDVSDRAVVLSHGDTVLTGPAHELRKDRRLLELSYFGETSPEGPQEGSQ